MQIHSVGIDLGKTTFHLVALGAAAKVLVKKSHTAPAADVHREPADFADRPGGLFRSAFPRTSIAEARPPCATDPCAVCEAAREVEQERLRGCGSDR
jgi:hypothetical protein